MSDRVSRMLSITALVAALIALGLSAYSASLLSRQEAEMRALSEAVQAAVRPGGVAELPMMGPPPELETDDY